MAPTDAQRVDVATQESPQTYQTGVFLTVGSLVSFPVASAVITIIWRLLQALLSASPAMKSGFVPLALAFVWGFLLFAHDQLGQQKLDAWSVVIKVIVGVINVLLLAAATLGIDAQLTRL